MNKILLSIFLLFTVVSPTLTQEKIVLSSPVPSVTEYKVTELLLSWGEKEGECTVSIRLTPNVASALDKQHIYRGPTACGMLKQLNTANLSTKSLQRRIMEQLITDKIFAGLPTGSPE